MRGTVVQHLTGSSRSEAGVSVTLSFHAPAQALRGPLLPRWPAGHRGTPRCRPTRPTGCRCAAQAPTRDRLRTCQGSLPPREARADAQAGDVADRADALQAGAPREPRPEVDALD